MRRQSRRSSETGRAWTTTHPTRRLDESAITRPTRKLMAIRELELAQDGRHVRLDRLHGDRETLGDLLIGVAACDQPQDLLLPRGELVDLRIGDDLDLAGEGVEHETGEPRREHRVAFVHPTNRVHELVGSDRLRDVPARTRPD